MCRECNQRRYQNKIKKAREIMGQYNIINEHANGYGWWSGLEIQTRIRARQEAWKLVGFAPSISSYLGDLTVSPKVAKQIGMDFQYLPAMGKITAQRMCELADEIEEKWQDAYNKVYARAKEWSKSFFEGALKANKISEEEYNKILTK
jgi:hypothetical protein